MAKTKLEGRSKRTGKFLSVSEARNRGGNAAVVRVPIAKQKKKKK